MKDAREILAMLTAGAQDFGSVGVGTGEKLTRSDVSAMLGGLDDGPSHLAFFKYMGDAKHEIQLELAIVTKVKGKWGSGTRQAIRLAMKEYVRGNTCPTCNGVKTMVTTDKVIECRTCRGSGVYHLSERQRSRLSGVPWATWQTRWITQYQSILRLLSSWDLDIKGHMKRQMRG